MIEHGTTTVEVKSGYGLTLDDELKMLRVIRELAKEVWIDVVPTFLGAHSFPPEYGDRRDEYVDLVATTMIPAVADSKSALFCDVFMEPGVYTAEQTARVLRSAVEHGLIPRLHADEFQSSGGAELAVEFGAASADHLGAVSEEGIAALAGSETVATLLPGTLMFLGKEGYPPARRLIERGAAVALATDFNPGSSPTVSLQIVMSLACSRLGMSPAEALVAVTANGAAALRLEDGRGTLEVGAPADVAAFGVPDYRLIPYLYGSNHCVGVWKRGVRVY
jgi:imidazolonepropionase